MILMELSTNQWKGMICISFPEGTFVMSHIRWAGVGREECSYCGWKTQAMLRSKFLGSH